MSDNLDKTQPLPRVTDEMANNDSPENNHNRVRHLEPVNINQGNRQISPHQGGYNGGYQHQAMPGERINAMPPSPDKGGKGKMILLLLVAFIFAMGVGLFVSGYISDQNLRTAEIKQQQEQSEKSVLATSEKKENLTERRAELNQRIKDLEKEQKKAQSEADNLKGKREQLDKSQKDKTGMEKAIDKISGKEAQDKKDAKEIDQQEKSVSDRVTEINKSIEDAKTAYNEINRQLDELEAMRQKAIKTKEEAEKLYNENKGLIDSVIYYVAKGMTVLQDFTR